MRIGLSTYDIAAHDFVALAQAADDAGFESVWLGEHVVLPLEYESSHPTTGAEVQHHTGPIVQPSTVLVDPLVAFGGAATVTRRISLATGIYLLPFRHPIVIARAVATLQDVAGGRFMLGAGSGWLREEFAALGIPFDERGSRFDETIDVLRALLSGEIVRHEGPHFSFGPVQLGPAPVHVPLVLGGNTDRALRRVAAKADGWFSSGTPSFDEACEIRDRIDRYCQDAGRTRALPLWFRVASPDPDLLARYERAGFENVVVWSDHLWPGEGDADERRASFAAAVERFGLVPDPARAAGAG